ncbi:MAG: 5-formyltetrahydrofolate cyclo-ligase [Verrucomicrobiota bacterium]
MQPGIQAAKAALRKQIRAALGNISPAVRAVKSIDLCERLKPQLRSARTILFFAPLPGEIDVWPLLEEMVPAGKTAALPRFDPVTQTYRARRVEIPAGEIVSGKFGVREPAAGCVEIPLEKFDLVLVPGVAFDLSGNRLGRGKGFYDQLLAKISGVKCGVGYDFQLLEKIPAEPHDAKVDFVITPARTMKTAG